jgi:iron(III) transport system permease protein
MGRDGEILRGDGAMRAGEQSSSGVNLSLILIPVLILVLLPIQAILIKALAVSPDSARHLTQTVLPRSLWQTMELMLGVGLLAGIMGTGLAWVTTMYRFPGRALAELLIVLPMAMPAYLVAYAYTDWLDPLGPVQSLIRSIGGYATPRDYWFPSVRSLGGAILLFAFVLYPYVYLAARASFVQQSVCVLEVARTLGRSPFGVFTSVALPLARPAIAAGVALVLMETLNDLGAVQYLGVETLSVAIAATWLERRDLPGAALLALVVLVLIGSVIAVERMARRGQRYHHTTGRYRAIPFQDVTGLRALGLFTVVLIPPLIGFVIPFLIFVVQAVRQWISGVPDHLWQSAVHSIGLAAIASLATLALGLALALVVRQQSAMPSVRRAVRLAGTGYAIPGTVLALGLLLPLAALDNWIADLWRGVFGRSPGLLVTGSITILILAYLVRFLAVAQSTVEAGFERLSPNLEPAARALGSTRTQALWRVELPLLIPTLGAAALLVFVDTMKELPATLLLRPFGIETLATTIYASASLEAPEQGAMAALLIVLAGLAPVLLLQRTMRLGRAG